jgi:eukaryotic-like serine/threonine-protein kinase
VLVKGAGMPRSAELPPSIQPLARRNALEISDSRFDYDAGRLVEALRRPAGARAPNRRARVSVAAAIVTALVAVAAIAYFVLRPGDVVAVPDLVGTPSAFHAERELVEADLRLSSAVREKVSADVRPGTVIGQTPPPGDRVDRDSDVTIEVAIATQSVTVPAVVGLTLRDAEQTLRRRGLTLGKVSPRPGDSSARIQVQSPAVNDKAPRGSRVDVGFAD